MRAVPINWTFAFLFTCLVLSYSTPSRAECDLPCEILQQSTCDTGCEGGTCTVLGEEVCCCPGGGVPELNPRGFISAFLLLLGGVLLIARHRRRSFAPRPPTN